MAAETSPPPAAPIKFSRYRSVRRGQEAQQQSQRAQPLTDSQTQIPPFPPMSAAPPAPPAPPALPIEPQKDATVSRSMSRYHRRPTTSHSTAPNLPPVPSNPEQQHVPPLPTSPPPTSNSARARAVSSPQRPLRAANAVQPRLPNGSEIPPEMAPLVAKGGREPSQTARDEAKRVMEQEAERQRRVQEKLRAEKRAKMEQAKMEQAERERQEREEKLRREEEEAERARRQREAEEAEASRRQKEDEEHGKRLRKERRPKHDEASASPPASPHRHGGFGIFKRRKDEAPASPESAASAARPRQTSNPDTKNRDLDTIRPGGGGAVLGIDAPISAVNAGDRRVMVVCNKSHILLPVTPTTTPLDLIKSASNVLTEAIEVRTAVILESFQKVGVKRALRNYEHVRDVMNSWDDDKQNDLLIVDSIAAEIDQQDLLASQVPDEKPPGMGCYIHYSSRPHKWSKRYLCLQEGGQLIMKKNETAKDHENVCHLSEFDIYFPTERKVSKVKPPKKICYAVKSQQKSNIFVDESRFVHFFCTNDRDTAALFYKSLHTWRSWHLKHVMGEGRKQHKTAEPKAFHPLSPGLNASGSTDLRLGGPSHDRGASVGSHYQLGSFLPLLDMGEFGSDTKKDEAAKPGSYPDDAPLGRLNSRAMHARKMSQRTKGPPPLSYNLGVLTQDSTQTSTKQNSLTPSTASPDEGGTFSPGGLLGQTYSQRQRQAQEREKQSSATAGPFTEGNSLLSSSNYAAAQAAANDSGLNRGASVRSHHRRTSSDIARSASTRAKPKPLIDLTPRYREPPQHARKGRGFTLEGGSGPLIENATSIEEAIKIPPSTDWRARPATARPSHGTYGVGGANHRGEGLAAYAANHHAGAPDDDSSAFTGSGLLARAGFSQGHTPVGRGVMDGSKARGPMLDLAEGSKFAAGTLLASVERLQGPTGPVIDREKRRSVDLV